MKNSIKGTLFILNSALFYASYGIWSRLMGGAFGKFTQAWTRGLLLLTVILLINLKFRLFRAIKHSDWIWFLIIALAGGLNQAPYYFGFQHLSIGTATLLFYASLVVSGYLQAKFALKEKINKAKLISLIVSIGGMILIYRFSLHPDQILAAILTCLAGFLGAATVVLTKKLSGHYHEFQIMAGYFILQVVINGPLALITHEVFPPTTSIYLWIAPLAYAFSYLIANFGAIEGFKYVEGSIGSLIGLAEILFGVLFGFLFFHEIISLSTLVGGLLIIFAAAFPSLIDLFHHRRDLFN